MYFSRTAEERVKSKESHKCGKQSENRGGRDTGEIWWKHIIGVLKILNLNKETDSIKKKVPTLKEKQDQSDQNSNYKEILTE